MSPCRAYCTKPHDDQLLLSGPSTPLVAAALVYELHVAGEEPECLTDSWTTHLLRASPMSHRSVKARLRSFDELLVSLALTLINASMTASMW